MLDFIRPYVDAYKVDLKTFNPKHYRQLGGVMENVTDTIRMLKERGFWVEIVTLVVPGFSDDPDDLKRMADFLASVDPLMPWHMTAFHPDYKMTDGYRSTTVDDLMRIVEFGEQAGLKYLYPGQPARPGRRVGKHPLPPLRRHGHRALRLPRPREPRRRRRALPRLPQAAARHLGQVVGSRRRSCEVAALARRRIRFSVRATTRSLASSSLNLAGVLCVLR